MQKLTSSRARLVAGASIATTAIGCLVACGDEVHDHSIGPSYRYDAGTWDPGPTPRADAAPPDACNTCGGSSCVDLANDVASCGACGHACPGSDHGSATCARGVCGLSCDQGFEVQSGACARVIPPPRPIAPLSGANVASARPALTWALAATSDGASIDICPTRACDHDAKTYTAIGERFVVPDDLAPGVHYWRLRGRAGKAAGATASPTWELFVGHRSAPIDTSVGTTLDLNGDGHADFVVADPGAARVYVYWGGPRGLSEEARTILATPPGLGEVGDFRVVGAGDIDGDGYPDLVVGDGARDAVYVFRGGPNGPNDKQTAILASPFPRGASFGSAVASIGDIDGDGYADIAVGAPGQHAVRIFFGGAGGMTSAKGITIVSPDATSRFGAALAGGDVDGDGYADLIVGAPGANAGAGAIQVFAGGPTMIARGPSQTIAGPDIAFAGFGSALALAGDVNGDGYADLIVGAPESISKRGRAYVFHGGASGVAPTASATFDGLAANDYLGASVASIGDVDGDGFADIAIGAPGAGTAIGRVEIYRGSADGVVASSRVAIAGPDGENFGYAIGGGGDAYGDGFASFIVGAHGSNHAYVFRGRAATPAFTASGPDTMTRSFGRGVAIFYVRRSSSATRAS